MTAGKKQIYAFRTFTPQDIVRLSTATIVTYATAPKVRAFSVANGTMDVPNQRSSHQIPVPRGGGIACLLGIASSAALSRSSHVRADLIASACMAAVGYTDDRTGGVPALLRLTAQVAVGAAISPQRSKSTVALVPVLVNTVNFMDGINGISGANAVIWGLFAASDSSGLPESRTLGTLTAGAGAGFLPHNIPVARLFLGDVGSYLLGALMACALSRYEPTSRLMFRTAAPLGPYLLDTSQALLRRLLRGEAVMSAHREHIYQRLVDDVHLNHVQVASVQAAFAIACGVAGRMSTRRSSTLVLAGAAGLYLTAPRWLKTVKSRVGIVRQSLQARTQSESSTLDSQTLGRHSE